MNIITIHEIYFYNISDGMVLIELIWISYFFDLNLIENLWEILILILMLYKICIYYIYP